MLGRSFWNCSVTRTFLCVTLDTTDSFLRVVLSNRLELFVKYHDCSLKVASCRHYFQFSNTCRDVCHVQDSLFHCTKVNVVWNVCIQHINCIWAHKCVDIADVLDHIRHQRCSQTISQHSFFHFQQLRSVTVIFATNYLRVICGSYNDAAKKTPPISLHGDAAMLFWGCR